MYSFTTPLAERLYEAVRALPIVDFHNHISVEELASDRRFRDITQLWLEADPYKHRAMRMLGVGERYITGDAAPFEKFEAWCGVFPELTGNPLQIWSQMELRMVFGVDTAICKENAEEIWNKVNSLLARPEYSAQNILKKFPVAYQAPCLAVDGDERVFAGSGAVPSLRVDGLFADLKGLCERCFGQPKTFAQLRSALNSRLGRLEEMGCKVCDISLDGGWQYCCADGGEEERFAALLEGAPVDKAMLDCDVLRLLAALCAKRGWTVLLHTGAQRQTSTRLRTVAGPAGGYAAIGATSVESITAFLDELEKARALPRTVLFAMDSAVFDRLAVLCGSFNREGHRGYVQLGPAWWWCDHMGGMVQVLESVMHYGCLSTFIGMTTDSRSLLSFSRHDYFRRVLCNWLGEKVRSGELAADETALTALAKKLCYENAAEYLGLAVEA